MGLYSVVWEHESFEQELNNSIDKNPVVYAQFTVPEKRLNLKV